MKKKSDQSAEQAIVIKIKFEKELEKIRKKLDPDYKTYGVHLTLIYRFKKLEEKILYPHMRRVIKEIKSFEIIFKGYSKSVDDNYLYFNIKKGRKEVMNLHKKLKTGPLKNMVNPKLPIYIPHITLGHFENKKEFDKAIIQLPKKLEIKEKIKCVYLSILNSKREVISEKAFKLK